MIDDYMVSDLNKGYSMAILKCKMCGGDLNVVEGQTVCQCDYCGSKQTVPTLDNEKKLTLFSRANRLRSMCEFDKAYSVYENIVSEFPEEAEAYWGLVLCKYGIEYVDDPATGKKIPTCHRSSFDNVMEDSNFEMVMEYADSIARGVYRSEAKEIERLRSGILEVSAKEQPYDIFICYKETDETGSRTIDSVIAQDVYTALTEKGYRVFFSRITLEDKLGQEYEPYIFAALHSAKIMLVFGTEYDHFNAVWVKNDWSRYLALIAKGEKKTLIPCYKDIDAYDMPQEFKRLQAQDMGKVGAMQDLLRGIEKIIPLQKEEKVKEIVRETVVVQQVSSAQGSPITALLKRVFMFLEAKNWTSADEYCEKVLDLDPENGDVYLAMLMSERKIVSMEALKEYQDRLDETNLPERVGRYYRKLNAVPNHGRLKPMSLYYDKVDQTNYYEKAIQYGSPEVKKLLIDINNRNIYRKAVSEMEKDTEYGYWLASGIFKEISGYQDAEELAEECLKKASELQDKRLSVIRKTGEIIKQRYSNFSDPSKRKMYRYDGIPVIAAGDAIAKEFAVGLRQDGTVCATGDNSDGQCNVSEWRDIVAIATGLSHTVGLISDGTVIATGSNGGGRCNVSAWIDIVSIAAGDDATFGVKRDGTVLIAGNNPFEQSVISGWKDIVSITATSAYLLGLKSDGTVCAVGKKDYRKTQTQWWEEVAGWKDIVSISASDRHIIGLKKDGTVNATGQHTGEDIDKCFNNTKGWENIVAIATGYSHTIGLLSDGTIVSVGNIHGFLYNDVEKWRDWENIISITVCGGYSFGIKSDGTILIDGEHPEKYDVSNWKLFDGIDALENILEQAEQRRLTKCQDLQKQMDAAAQDKQTAGSELANLKGLFTGKRRKELEEQIAQDGKMIEQLQRELKYLES